jgi:hypothetical protein
MNRRNRTDQAAVGWLLLLLALTLSPTMVVQAQTRENLNRPPQDEDYLWWRLPASDQQYARIDGYRIKDHVRELTAIARTTEQRA